MSQVFVFIDFLLLHIYLNAMQIVFSMVGYFKLIIYHLINLMV